MAIEWHMCCFRKETPETTQREPRFWRSTLGKASTKTRGAHGGFQYHRTCSSPGTTNTIPLSLPFYTRSPTPQLPWTDEHSKNPSPRRAGREDAVPGGFRCGAGLEKSKLDPQSPPFPSTEIGRVGVFQCLPRRWFPGAPPLPMARFPVRSMRREKGKEEADDRSSFLCRWGQFALFPLFDLVRSVLPLTFAHRCIICSRFFFRSLLRNLKKKINWKK